MAAQDSMRLDEARTLLGVSANADIEAVKSAYRKLAFRLHPDLHPDDPGAKRKFQRLNEAYLLLRHYLADRDDTAGFGPPGGEARTAGPKASPGPGAGGRTSRPGGPPPPPPPPPPPQKSRSPATAPSPESAAAPARPPPPGPRTLLDWQH